MTFADYGIDTANKNSGQISVRCPKCSDDRKKKSVKCLTVNFELGWWKCNHCGWAGNLKKKQYAVPTWDNRTDLPDVIVEWFVKRNIGQDVIREMKITHEAIYMPQVNESRKCICFNYFRAGKLVNVKYRDRDKNFRFHVDAELILYNLDGITDQKEIFITEGEADAMIMVQAGFKNTCSVPNGATMKNNNLKYMDNCWWAFEKAEKVYIMTDNDEPGNKLADELARRIGVERCYRVKFDDPFFKDVNDAVNSGQKVTRELLEQHAKIYPIVGVHTAGDHWDALVDIRKNGFPKGWKLRPPFGNHVTIHPGYQTIITGIPSHGKSEHLDEILLELAVDYDLKGIYFSKENHPTAIHIMKIIEKLSGKNFWKLSESEVNDLRSWIEQHIFWVNPDSELTLTNILAHIRKAILRYGINWYVIDPWNRLDHQYQGSETSYISRCLDEMEVFNKTNNVHGFLVAHPTKIEKDKAGNYLIPNLYSISGSSNFFNKADLGWTVYKTGEGTTDIYIQKVKFKYWGHVGKISLLWDKENGRYYSTNPDKSHWLKKEQNLFSTMMEKEAPMKLEVQGINQDSCPF